MGEPRPDPGELRLRVQDARPRAQVAAERMASLDARAVLVRLAAQNPGRLAERLNGEALASIARALRVRSTGRKLDVARGIVARADLLSRLTWIGDQPARVARTFRRDSLLAYAEGLGCFTALNKYGLAATVLGTRD